MASGPQQISFDVTTNCNLKCVHCFNDSGSSAPFQDISVEQKKKIAQQIAAFHPVNVCLCGGEPTMSPVLFELMDILRPDVGKLSMVSNGFSMTPELAKKLVDHGLSMGQISIDGAYAWQHDSFRGVAGSYARAKNAVRYLKEAGLRQIDTSLVPNRLNMRTMPEYTAMCFELGVKEIRMMPFLPSGRGVSVGSALLPDEEEKFRFCRTVEKLKAEYDGRMAIQWGDPIDHMRRMPILAEKGNTTYVMEIKTNGDLTFTTYIPVVAGNCTKYTLQEYWEAGYKTIWKDKRYTVYSDKIRDIYDLEEFEPQPYTGETIQIDLMEGSAV